MTLLPTSLKEYKKPDIQQRLEWIDNMKGIAMVLVMLSHMSISTQAGIIFKPFFLSIFFVVSGYTFNIKGSFKEFIINKTRTLFIPAFLLACIQIIFSCILTFTEQEPLKDQVIELMLQNGGQGSKMWFVFALFVFSIFFYIITRYIENTGLFICFVTAAFFICLAYNYYGGSHSFPWYIHLVGIGCFYMAAGYIHRVYEQYNLLNNKDIFYRGRILTVFCSIGYILLIGIHLWKWKEVQVSFRVFEAPIWLYLAESILGTLAVYLLLRILPGIKIVGFIGKNTLIYFAFHGKVQRIAEVVFNKLNVDGIIRIILVLIIQCLVLAAISILVNKYFPFLAGKKYEPRRKHQFKV